ncbi:MAG: cation diffusion facilitator family transporter [Actinomycetes bacterium]
MSTEGGVKAVIAALAANLGIAVAKFVAFAVTGSSSMMSEGIHSLADSGNQVLLLIGGKRAKAAPDSQHQFGYGRRRYVYGFVVSMILFSVGGLFALYEGIHKIEHPEQIHDAAWAIGVLLVAAALEGFSFRTALHEANRSRGEKSLFHYVRDTRQPELPVVLLEDSGALVGLVLALIGVTMSMVTGNGVWDGIGSASIGLLLLVIAGFLALEMASMLVGESAVPQEEGLIRSALESTPAVDRVIHLRTLHVGPDDILVAAKVAVDGDDSAARIAAAIDDAERRVRAAVPAATYIYLEPDLDRFRPDAQPQSPLSSGSSQPGGGFTQPHDEDPQ